MTLAPAPARGDHNRQARLFVSTFPYALIKNARALGQIEGGPEAETALIMRHERMRAESPWPCYKTVASLEQVEPVILCSDASGSISQSRSRMAGRFLRLFGQCDVWATVDDDIEASEETVRRLVVACRASSGIVTVPYLLRDGRTASISGLRKNPAQALWTAASTGMGLVAIHRSVLTALADVAPRAIDDKGLRYPALFLEFIDEWLGWLGEDIAFCRRVAEARIPIHVLTDAPIVHAGRSSMLTLDGALVPLDERTAETMAR